MKIREQRGLVIAARFKLIEKENEIWIVPSQSKRRKNYTVDYRQSTCTCKDFENGNKCKHMWAVEYTFRRECGQEVPNPPLPLKKRMTYKQNWPCYNTAQSIEKHRFWALLHDLCRCVEDFTRKPGSGRPPTSAADAVYAAVSKVYSTVSTRRFSCDLRDAQDKGYVNQKIHYNSVCRYLENPELTPRLHALIKESSRPLNTVETVFAVDSTGFTTSRFVRWYDEKYGVKSGHDWVKAHVMCGVTTHAVTAVVIENRSAADAPQFKHLLEDTAKTFKIVEVSGDKAYLSVENIEAVFQAGGIPYIAFKVNSTGAVGGLFQKSFHFYNLHREEFEKHYHQRSNVEATFSAIKRKFSDYVRSRTDVAMVNEVLCKILCHNISCLIHSQCELGIEPVFWGANDLPKKEE